MSPTLFDFIKDFSPSKQIKHDYFSRGGQNGPTTNTPSNHLREVIELHMLLITLLRE
jgi:hypothetical protein